MGTEPVAPKIPEVGDKIGCLDGWVSSEDPKEGRFPETTDACDQQHADT